jgi:hypothetical protein
MADEIALLRAGVDAWRDRALKAEARLAGMEKALDGVEPFVSKVVALLMEAREAVEFYDANFCSDGPKLLPRIDAILAMDIQKSSVQDSGDEAVGGERG